MISGDLTFETPMLFALGFLVTVLFGGLSGVPDPALARQPWHAPPPR
jgi:heme/copper-type cytochrome/quinol oxidase subunit 1